jgi:serine/threonine protein kinase/Flp pilus assembly protein TadD
MRPTLSRYAVLGRLASGGMADVWLAQALGASGFEKLVVLKTMLPGMARDPEFAAMFFNEARLAANLNHPNCVQTLDLGQEKSTHFLAMEYVDGFSLARVDHRCRDRAVPLPPEVLVRVVMDAAAGLDYAHRLTSPDGKPLKLVHRDISPDNILVSFTGQTKVADFGIAKAVAQPGELRTRTGRVKGKFGYMAPEYLRGQPIDGRADLFALGVVLFRLLSGKRPFEAPSEPMIIRAVLEAEPDNLHRLDARIPAPLAAVVAKALQKSPELRFQTAREMREALGEALVPADAEQVGQFMEQLWPPDDPERRRIRELASGATADSGESLLEEIISGESAVQSQPSSELPTATDLKSPGGRVEVKKRPLALMVALALAVAGLGAGGAYLALRKPGAPKRQAPISMLIADFENQTGEAVFDGTLEPVLKLALETAGFVNAYDRNGLKRTLGVRLEGPLDDAAAREVAVKQGLSAVLTGSIARKGDGYLLSVKATRALTGEVLVDASGTAGSQDQVLTEATALMAKVRTALGDDTSDKDQLFSMLSLSTRSLEAMQHYSAALDAQADNELAAAMEHARKAVEKDPELGSGYNIMAAISMVQGRPADAERYARESLKHLDKLTERERFMARGAFYRMTGDYQQCVAEFQALVTRNPKDVGAHNQLALCSSLLRDLPTAVKHMRIASEVVPGRVVFKVNLALYSAYSGDFDGAEQVAQSIEAKNSYRELALAFAHLGRGELDLAGERYRAMQGYDAEGAFRGTLGLADLASYRGHFAESVKLLEPAAAAQPASEGGYRAAVLWSRIARQLSLKGDAAGAVRAARRSIELNQLPPVRFFAARVLAEAGQPDEALKLALALSEESAIEPRAFGKHVEGVAMLAKGEPRRAVQLLTEAVRLLDTWLSRYDLSRAYLEAGMFPQADSELDRCMKRRGEALSVLLDEEPTFGHYPYVFLVKARILEALESDGAAAAWRTYVETRAQGSDDPQLIEARKRAGL